MPAWWHLPSHWHQPRWPASVCVPATASLVVPGELVQVGQPLLTQARETALLEVPLRGELGDLQPGAELDLAQLQSAKGIGREQPRPGDRAYLLYVGADRPGLGGKAITVCTGSQTWTDLSVQRKVRCR